MEKFVREHVNIPKWSLFLAFIAVLASGLSYFYIFTDVEDAKILSLLSGLISGLVLYILSFITGIFSIREIDRFKKLKIRNLLNNRHDKAYYRPLFANAKKHVEVMGASCTRLIGDFLDQESDDKALVDAMRSHPDLKIRILLPKNEFMNTASRNSWTSLDAKVEQLKNEFKGQIEFRRFEHSARHSFVVVDNDLIAGPIFEGQDSKHAPAVHVDITSEFAKKYMKYFEDRWKSDTTT